MTRWIVFLAITSIYTSFASAQNPDESATVKTDKLHQIDGAWLGTATVGQLEFRYLWNIQSEGSAVHGTIEISDNLTGELARYKFRGEFSDEALSFQGTSMLENSSQRYCIASGDTRLISIDDELVLEGSWRGSSIPGGCSLGSSGGIRLVKQESQGLPTSGHRESPARVPSMQEDILVAYDNDMLAINKVADFADYAVLAWAAYGEHDALSAAKERGWSPLQSIYNENLFEGDTVATLFVSNRGKHVVAFRGTKTKYGDNLSNVGTLDPTPLTNRQAAGARTISDEMVAAYPEVIFVGHSLGGRLAQVARLQTGNAAVKFNSAPLGNNDNIMAHPSKDDEKASLTSFRSPLDPLTKAFIGFDINVKNIEYSNDFKINHSMGILARAMQDVRLARENEGLRK